jgi:hypothetical protein
MKPKKFDPYKETGGVCNGFRALCAEQSMDHHQTQKDCEVLRVGGEPEPPEPFAERLCDLLTDLMHLAHQQEESFDGALMVAKQHFEEESK